MTTTRKKTKLPPVQPGDRFGKLTVTGEAEWYTVPSSGKRKRQWHVLCDCGTERVVREGSLRTGNTTCCGKGDCHSKPLLGRTGESHPMWAGEVVTYDGMHRRVYAERGSASGYLCTDTGERADHWSWQGWCDEGERVEVGGRNDGYRYCTHIEHFSPRSREAHQVYDDAFRNSRRAVEAGCIDLAA